MSSPTITTVIPTYRRPRLLRRAIESVLAQTYPHVHVLVCDNASGDETQDIVAELAQRYKRMRRSRWQKLSLEEVVTRYSGAQTAPGGRSGGSDPKPASRS